MQDSSFVSTTYSLFVAIVILKGLKASIKPLPWVPEVFSRVRRGASFRPKAEDTSGEAETQNRE